MESRVGRKIGPLRLWLAGLMFLSPFFSWFWITDAKGTGSVALRDDRPHNHLSFNAGDVLFVSGTSLVSSLIRGSQGRFSYTHVALVVMVGEQLAVIDADYDREKGRDGVTIQPLPVFLEKFEKLMVVKNARLSEQARRDISTRALGFSDRKFDLFLKPDSREIYCTELVAKALMQDPGSLLDNDRILTPVNLYKGLERRGWRKERAPDRPPALALGIH